MAPLHWVSATQNNRQRFLRRVKHLYSEYLKCFKTQEIHVYIVLSSGAKLVIAHGLSVTDSKCIEIKLFPIKAVLLFSAGVINFHMNTPVEALQQDPAVPQECLMKQIPANAGHKNNLHNNLQFKQAKIVIS